MQGTTMECSKLQARAAGLAKDLKTEADLNALYRELLKLTVETALGAKLTEHRISRSEEALRIAY